jgi:hypothetical protein
LTEGWVHFKNEGGVVFSTRTMDSSQYPDLSSLLTVEGTTITFPAELKNGIAKAREVLDLKDTLPCVEINAKKGVLLLSAKGPYVSLKERYKVDFQDIVIFRIHPDMLNDAIDMAADCIIGTGRLLLSCAEQGYSHVIGLIMPEAVEAAQPPAEEGVAAQVADNPPPAASEKAKRKPRTKAAPVVAPEPAPAPVSPPPAPMKPVAAPAPVKPISAPAVVADEAW